MGQLFCCGKVTSFNSTNQFLFQLNRFIPKPKNSESDNPLNASGNNSSNLNISQISDNNNNDSKNKEKDEKEKKEKQIIFRPERLIENLNSQKGKYKFVIYDIMQNNTLIIEKKIEIIKSLEGLSELNLEHNLYLCGNSRLENNEGSFLFEISPINPKSNMLVNSIYGHYYPSLISFKNEYIFCIGGKNQINCEYYNIEEKFWTPLPNLPEERYRCTLCLDKKNDTIYLFGGINSKKQNINSNEIYIENNYILRMKITVCMMWETIVIKNEYEKVFLERISAGSLIFDDQEDDIYILGGENKQKKFLDTIIKFNIHSFSLTTTDQKLKFPTTFLNQYPKKCGNDNYLYFFIDNFNNIIKIDEHNFLQLSENIFDI